MQASTFYVRAMIVEWGAQMTLCTRGTDNLARLTFGTHTCACIELNAMYYISRAQ
jgi:hypothetical protein